jgi:type I restriction enzyme, S subunit
MSARVPKDWRVSTLGTEVEAILGGGTPSKAEARYWDGDIPWVTVKDLKSRVLHDTEERITAAGVQASATRVVPSGTVIMATRMAVVRSSRQVGQDPG